MLCHGAAADGRQFAHAAEVWAKAVPQAVFVAGHAPFRHTVHRLSWLPVVRQIRGREWFCTGNHGSAAEEAGVHSAALYLESFVQQELQRISLPDDALALGGFSQGAMLALYAGLRRAVPPRCILACAGALIAPQKVCGKLNGRRRVLLAHGEADTVVPVARSRYAEKVLQAAGVSVESLYEPGVGHSLNETFINAGAAFLRRALI